MDLDPGTLRIDLLDGPGVRAAADGLGALLADAVRDGASVGFLAPLGDAAAQAEAGVRTVWAAHGAGGALLGAVTLVRATAPNQRHRGDIAKLLVHTSARGRGLGRALLAAAEEGAAGLGLTLLVLDTETGSPAEHLYRSAGWTRAGTIPGYAADPAGRPRPTTYYYKTLA
ncbi:GNAT family N-acetyltransferase [Streptomyces fradiae]|uniref:GNAT family N-acetyltransferase n=1 Tax=Streptomyces fradiae TaxID=1906 RepID=UPI0033C07B19